MNSLVGLGRGGAGLGVSARVRPADDDVVWEIKGIFLREEVKG